MKKFRKLSMFLLAVMMLFNLAACGNSPTSQSEQPSAAQTETDGPDDEPVLTPYTGVVQLVVGASPGGISDLSARMFAKCFSRTIGQEVVVINVEGGGGAIAMQQVNEAPADGYTLYWLEENNLTNYAIGTNPMAWSDMDMVAMVGGTATTCFLASATTGIDSIESMIKYYEENGPISMAISYGAPSHFMTAALARATGVELRNVDLSGGSDKVLAVVSGQLQMTQLDVAQFQQYVDNGDMNVICSMSAERNSFIPDIKTAKEQGYDVGDFCKFWAVGVKKGTDSTIISNTSAWIKQCMESAETAADYESVMYFIDYRNTEDAIQYFKDKESFYNDIAEFILNQNG